MRKEVLAVGCALMVFCGCGKNNAAQHYESGWAAMEKKDYTTAVNEFQQTGRKLPGRRNCLLFRKGLSGGDCCFFEKSEQYG